MDEHSLRNLYNRARIDDRQINELIGLARGMVADGVTNKAEAEYLLKWLAANRDATSNPVISTLFDRVSDYLDDGKLDDDEAKELFDTLTAFAGGEFEIGEALKSSTLPLCSPPPAVIFPGKLFCLTGTFAFGSRSECEQKVFELGGRASALTKKTDYLVIGIYATDSWAHSSYGRKIEHAAGLRSQGLPIHIIGEQHWANHLP